jgi:hypothetical protein
MSGQAMHVVISEESYDGWRQFCAIHGTNMTALAEAIGVALAGYEGPEGRLPPMLRAMLVESRRIAAERASRRRHD